jgi:hypothetical protein
LRQLRILVPGKIKEGDTLKEREHEMERKGEDRERKERE